MACVWSHKMRPRPLDRCELSPSATIIEKKIEASDLVRAIDRTRLRSTVPKRHHESRHLLRVEGKSVRPDQGQQTSIFASFGR